MITGKQPTGLFDMQKMSLAYVARAGVYYGLLTEQFLAGHRRRAGRAGHPADRRRCANFMTG